LETPLLCRGVSFLSAGSQAMKKHEVLNNAYVYHAPIIYMGIFYAALVAWTIICILLIGFKVTQSEWGNLFQLFMFAFIIAMTWYFSMGISYRVNVEEDGTVQLTSFRRILRIHSQKMELIEGPHLPIGFVRFRLEREKAYLFCVAKNSELQKILLAIRKTNPDIKFKNIRITKLNGRGF
jgi:uncharacterized membrane protein YphA (DoxX/SURF4 family)